MLRIIEYNFVASHKKTIFHLYLLADLNRLLGNLTAVIINIEECNTYAEV